MIRAPQKLLAIALFSATASVSAAGFEQDNLSVGAQIGMLGYGLNAEYQFTDQFSGRAEVNTYSRTLNKTESDVDYKFKAKLNTFGLLANYQPFNNGFHVTGGIYHNGNKLTGSGQYIGTQNLVIGDVSYAGTELASVDTKIDFNSIAPYLGAGYKANFGAISVGFDVGVLFQGTPDVSLTVVPTATLVGSVAALQTEVDKEIAELKDDLKDFKYLPVVKVTFSYEF